MTVLHAAQAVLVLVLANGFAITITSSYPTGPPGTKVPAPTALFEMRIGVAIAVFLGLAAFDHLLTATVFRARYESDLRAGNNRFRWVEYSLSATLMVLLIASYAGITEISAVIGIIGANVAMILFGWLQEVMNPPERSRTTMVPFWFGVLVGVAPWVAIVVNLAGVTRVPGFVYGIFFALFAYFISFAVNRGQAAGSRATRRAAAQRRRGGATSRAATAGPSLTASSASSPTSSLTTKATDSAVNHASGTGQYT